MNALWIPILAIVCSVGLPLSIPIVFLVLNYRKQRRLVELQHAERMAAIERGMDVPPLQLGSRASRRSTLLPGLIWLFVGLALIFGLQGYENLVAFDHGGARIIGFVPTAIGLAYLIFYAVEDRQAIRARLNGEIQSPAEEKSSAEEKQ